MDVSEQVVEQVVAQVSERMQDPKYGQLAVGEFLQRHPDVGRYVSARASKLGSEEMAIHAIFHAHVLAECLRSARERDARAVGFGELDAAYEGEPLQTLTDREPALADYVRSNVEGEEMQRTVALIGLALLRG
jgi:hypothetical protein